MMNRHPPIRLFQIVTFLVLGMGLCAGGRCAGSRTAGPAVAVVTNLSGPAQLRRAAERRSIAVLDVLQAGDQLQLQATASLELAFTAGAGCVLQLTGPGRFSVRGNDVLTRDPGARVERRDLAAAWREVRIRPGLVGRASIALRGLAANAVTLRTPRGGEDGPALQRLEWNQPYGHPAGPWGYTVRVIDDQGALMFLAQSQERSVSLPATLEFERGRDYLWTVEAHAQDHASAYGAAEFHRVAADAEDGMQALWQSVMALRRDPAQPEPVAEEVLLALALEQSGLQNAAQRQWRALAIVRPALADWRSLR